MADNQSHEERTSRLAVEYSRFYRGKIETVPKVPVRNLDDFSVWYTPGVAAVSRLIQQDKDLSFEYTGRWNTVAIISDGSRVLGLGNVGPHAAMPVMEGKSLIYKYLGGVDAVPLTLGVHSEQEIINTIKSLEPSFGGINLEDTESPKCFHILDRLVQEMEIPVWHDDQQGTAGVTLAGLINALKVTKRKLKGSSIIFLGTGAANIATGRLLASAGADQGDFVYLDSKGILHPERSDIDELMLKHRLKYELAIKTNRKKLTGDLRLALKSADILIAASSPTPGLVKKEWIKTMNSNPIVFALANPIPEIYPSEALEAGAGVVATGRSDFPNQVNNSLLFPSVFRGVLDVAARKITDEMVIAAAQELAHYAEEKGLSKDHIIPTMVEWEVYPRVAARVGEKAVQSGTARKKLSRQEIFEQANEVISRARKLLSTLMETKLIPKQPG